MSTNTFPQIRSQEDQRREDMQKLEQGSDRDKGRVLLSALLGYGYRNLPTTSDADKIAREALDDFARSDYSEASSAVNSLVMIVDFYKELAEKYHEALSTLGAVIDEYGDVTKDPFALVDESGAHVLGNPEVVFIKDYEGDMDTLWLHYVRDAIPFANEAERAWVADRFAPQIEREAEAS